MNAPLEADTIGSLRAVALDDKYALEHGRAFMSGNQALVRLPMLQRARDRLAGHQTAGFISGYRGSPLGSLDQALWKAREHLERQQIVFKPGINEELAANALWGTQQIGLFPKATAQGVFGLWYGKGPGVDRCGDVFKHANAAGSAPLGGVVVVAGDDHGAKSSTLAHQSEPLLKACGLPIFYPAGVQELLDYGQHGWAMSRWSGLWVAMKAVTDIAESSASVVVDPDHVAIVLPEDFRHPPGGLNIRWPDTALGQEQRLAEYKWDAALAYVRANRLNAVTLDSHQAWLGIVAAGKAYLDTRQALDDLGLEPSVCELLGIRVFKIGVVWPLEAHSLQAFARGLGEILVVEEKAPMIEQSVRDALYHWPDDQRPTVYGKQARPGAGAAASHGAGADVVMGSADRPGMAHSRWQFPAFGELSPALVARVIGRRLLEMDDARTAPRSILDALGPAPQMPAGWRLPPAVRTRVEARLAMLAAQERGPLILHADVQRTPTFCSGCPHNTSTHVPEGSFALAGIGCHFMAIWDPKRRTATFSQMGGEGVAWIGQSPFTQTSHVFANLGDGTYFHSGILAIRAAVAAQTNITYKLLYNDAVAMTGGQALDGSLTVAQLVAQLQAEGVIEVVIVTDEPAQYEAAKRAQTRSANPMMEHALDGVAIVHRDDLDATQKRLRAVKGVTVLVYVQTCASEKRRRRKRKGPDGAPGFPDPARRLVINEAVCEGCGDCSEQSSCVSVEPLETPFGRKRRVNQSSCNKDYSCLKGFCPSFVTVEGGQWRGTVKQSPAVAPVSALPEPATAPIARAGAGSFGILVTGVGGTGVVTIGQLLGMAAHLEGYGVVVLDMAGLAQKGGAVTSHIQIGATQDQLSATRVALGEADLVIGGDLVVTAGTDALARMRPGVTRVVINADVAPTVQNLRNPDWILPDAHLRSDVLTAAGAEAVEFIEAQRLAVALCGDAIFANPLLLGWASQRGWLPVSRTALERAIELNGAAVAANLQAFAWGRRAAHDTDAVRRLAFGHAVQRGGPQAPAASLDEAIALRAAHLAAYQDARLAQRFLQLVGQVRQAEAARMSPECIELTQAVVENYFRVLAYKDEYEVARLHSDPAFLEGLRAQFEGAWSVRFHLAPPLLARLDHATGRPRKMAFGPWLLPVLRGLAKLRFLRGTAFDPFGYTLERRAERNLITQYEALVAELVQGLQPERHALAVRVAHAPDLVRGFGPVKKANLALAQERWRGLMHDWRSCAAG
jgi:indolepyruvate ferredoxin oxidoreductase